MIDLKKREELEKAATPGPWSVVGHPWNELEDYVIAGHDDPHVGKFVCDCGGQRDFETGDQASRPNERNDATRLATIGVAIRDERGDQGSYDDQRRKAFCAAGWVKES